MTRKNAAPASSWRCPACTLSASAPDKLAAHIRSLHMTPAPSEDARVRWKCPLHDCERFRRPLQGPFSLTIHLDAHAAQAAEAARRERKAQRSPDRSPVAGRSREDLAALDWSQSNRAIADLLGVSAAHAATIRKRLQDEGHPVPNSGRGRPFGSSAAIEKYMTAGIGIAPDRVVAERLHVTPQAVHHMRRRKGIAAPRTSPRARRSRYASPATQGQTAIPPERLCPRCLKRPRPLKGVSPSSVLRSYRLLCNTCARRERLDAGFRDPAPPVCPVCGSRPRVLKGMRRGRPRYRARCGRCHPARHKTP